MAFILLSLQVNENLISSNFYTGLIKTFLYKYIKRNIFKSNHKQRTNIKTVQSLLVYKKTLKNLSL